MQTLLHHNLKTRSPKQQYATTKLEDGSDTTNKILPSPDEDSPKPSTHSRKESTSKSESNTTPEGNGVDDTTNKTLPIPEEDSPKPYTALGIFSILTLFYQIKSLLAVTEVDDESREQLAFFPVISKIFNLKLLFEFTPTICTMSHLDVVSKHFVKDFLFNASMPLLILLATILLHG